MSDEWNDWKQAWDAGARSLPEIQAQADKQRRRMILGIAGIWVIGLGVVIPSLVSAFAKPTWVNVANAIVQSTFITSMLTFTHVSMWGNWREPNETPDAQLALMERRWQVRRRITFFVQWGGLALCLLVAAGAIAIFFEVHATLGFLAGQLAVALGGIVFFRVVSIRMRKKMDAAIAELAEQRRLLRESDPGDAEA